MPSFQDSAVLIILALLLFGPKKLPELARQLGKLMNDFRRASNEFRSQMEDELRLSEQADRQKQVAAVPVTTPALDTAQTIEAESVYANQDTSSLDSTHDSQHNYPPEEQVDSTGASSHESPYESLSEYALDSSPETTSEPTPVSAAVPDPIATSGELSILPPSSGLPTPNSASGPLSDSLLAESAAQASVPEQESAAHEAEALHG